jgi:hypothetical protein
MLNECVRDVVQLAQRDSVAAGVMDDKNGSLTCLPASSTVALP